ncbi:MAG: tRNA (adenosine(37)-N6)-threonylcarbamoyltransferase complex ATPase subunit type 1 TsaE [Bdellovibrio sp. 28-41-41]|nr:MAG: tRNA (adenosine(37)-N6)-threonylcarbamoyltransferase complex ATPase subunit type 1 TsaE [Bdellovibrio sp. 28-41-41]
MTETLVLQTPDQNEIILAVQERLKTKTFVGFRGDMGAGKTTFISTLLKDQGAAVSSPTFALHNTYKAFGLSIVHVDLYRLHSSEEVDSSGFWDLFADPDSAILTEWVERISIDEIPLDWKKWFLQIQVQPGGQRTYSLFSFS